MNRFPASFRFLYLLGALLLWPTQLMAQSPALVTIPVDSPAASFSPGNWAGDAGRGGSAFRVTWNSGAYCTFSWSTTSEAPTAMLGVTNATAGSRISYYIDGNFVDQVDVPAAGGIPITKLVGNGPHELRIYTASSQQTSRWDRTNAFKITGLMVDAQSTPGHAPAPRPWVAIIGDSITEGIGVPSNLEDYSFLVGQGLQHAGFDYAVSACGYSGWLRPGDGTGDVPAYYSISGSANGTGGTYNESASRWNKIDSTTSLLDSAGHWSGWGGTGQEPSVVVFNYIVNETLSNSNASDCQASVSQCLAALRTAAPQAWIFIVVPPGLRSTAIYPKGGLYIAALESGMKDYQAAHPQDKQVVEIDLGTAVANALASPAYGGGVHPNAAGHAYITPLLLNSILSHLPRPASAP